MRARSDREIKCSNVNAAPTVAGRKVAGNGKRKCVRQRNVNHAHMAVRNDHLSCSPATDASFKHRCDVPSTAYEASAVRAGAVCAAARCARDAREKKRMA